ALVRALASVTVQPYNDSVEQTGRPTALPRPELRPGRPAAHFRRAQPTSSTHRMPRFQVALSFAGEQRQYVERVARALQARGIALFYDRFEKLTLWGKDGIEFFHEVFSAESAFVVMFFSAE